MIDLRHKRTPVLVLASACFALCAGCSRSHEVAAVGAAGNVSCVAYWLSFDFDYGSSVFVHRNATDEPAEPIEIPIIDPLGGNARFSAVTTLDLDGDGLRDVVVRDAYLRAALLEERVSLTIVRGSESRFEARERQTFVGVTDVPAGGGITAVGDWNGDGLSDLGAEYGAEILLSGDTLTETAEGCDRAVGVGDVDLDGSDDTVCMGPDDTQLILRLGGTASPETRELSPGVAVLFYRAAGDLDGDGRSELLVEHRDGWGAVHLVDGSLTEISGHIRDVQWLGDVDGDGFGDFAAHMRASAHLWRGGPDGPTEEPEPLIVFAEGEERSIHRAGDANCDGFGDVLARERLAGEPDRTELLLGGPSGVSREPAWRATVDNGTFIPIYD